MGSEMCIRDRQRTVSAGRNGAGLDRKFGRKRHNGSAVGEMGADGGADAAVNPRAQNSVLPAEYLKRRGEILIRPQPQREGAALGFDIGAGARDGAEQFEIGLGIGFGHKHRTVDSERFHRERFGDDALLGQNVAAVQALSLIHI